MYGNWSEINHAVAAIDSTSPKIYKPSEKKELYYSEHRGAHCIHTLVIFDNTNPYNIYIVDC